MRLKADCCYCFEVSGYPDEARSMKHQFLVEFLKQVADYYSFIVVSFWWLNNSYSLNVITTVWMECIIWESSNLIWCLSCSAFVRHGWIKFNVSDTQNFWRAKRVCYQFCSEIYSLQEQMSVTDFSRMARLGRFTADCLWLKTFPGREKWWGYIKSIGC